MPYRIVVADPSVSVQKAIQAVLPEPDFRVFVFEEGTELVEALPDLRPDSILLGLSLNGLDAYEVGRWIGGREDLRVVPLFFLKGTFESFDPDKAEGISCDGVFQKPFDSKLLGTAIREAIDRKLSPPTMPEELLFDEVASTPPVRESVRETGNPRVESAEAGDDDVRDLVRREILDMEREVEKRVRARVLTDIKEWLSGQGRQKEPLA